jgi:hypothetical protein
MRRIMTLGKFNVASVSQGQARTNLASIRSRRFECRLHG